jgi:putative membrane protein
MNRVATFILSLAVIALPAYAAQGQTGGSSSGSSAQSGRSSGSQGGSSGSMSGSQGSTSSRGSGASSTERGTEMNSSSSSKSQSGMGSSSGNLNSTDRTFVTKAAQGGLAEVELGQMAEQKASNDAVKNFAKRMVADHTKSNNELKSQVQQMGVSLPTTIDAKAQSEKDRLSKLSGSEFDKQYIQHEIQDHRQDISEFQKQANSGGDETLRSFASKTLPTLQEHLQLAEQANSQLNK